MDLALAMIIRVLLVLSLSWVMCLTATIFNMGDWIGIVNKNWVEKLAISGRDLILLISGLF